MLGTAESTASVTESTPANLESVAQASIIFAIGLAIIVSNLLIIAVYYKYTGLVQQVINHYLLSLAIADLLCGLFIVPLSFYAAIKQDWPYGSFLCRLAGYVEVTLWCVSVYTFMWISVDRYRSIRKPLRYETVSVTLQSRARGQCWMVFTWAAAAMLCSPPLLGYKKEANFDSDALVCMLDWGTTSAYTLTLGVLVLGPSIISIVYSYLFIFWKRKKTYSGLPNHDKEHATALAENLASPNQKVSFILIITFWMSWTPYAIVCFYEYMQAEVNNPMVHFVVVWIGILNSCSKIFVMLPLSPEFRLAFKLLCKSLFCRPKVRVDGDGGMTNVDTANPE